MHFIIGHYTIYEKMAKVSKGKRFTPHEDKYPLMLTVILLARPLAAFARMSSHHEVLVLEG